MSTTETRTVQRKFRVCAKNKCKRCKLRLRTVPEGCEWILKHALDTELEGMVFQRPRRSGKTTEIIKLAKELIDGGYDVLVVTRDQQMVNELHRRMMGTGAKIVASLSETSFDRAMCGPSEALVLSDEVGEWVTEYVRKTRHEFVVGYHTGM